MSCRDCGVDRWPYTSGTFAAMCSQALRSIMGLTLGGAIPLPCALPQVLNLENWQQIMFSLVRANNMGAAAYCITWVIVGGLC